MGDRARRRLQPEPAEMTSTDGTNAAYIHGCVCSDCRAHEQVRMGRGQHVAIRPYASSAASSTLNSASGAILQRRVTEAPCRVQKQIQRQHCYGCLHRVRLVRLLPYLVGEVVVIR